MSELELVHPVPHDDALDWARTVETTLLGTATGADFPRYAARWTRAWNPDRTWAYRDRGRIVATLATESRTLSVPGVGQTTNEVEADALTGVTVAATHRRRGLLRDMITRSLANARDLGHPVGILVAAEWPIYGRFGYAPAAFSASYTYYPRRRYGGLPAPPHGSVRQVDPGELGAAARVIFDRARRQRPGQIDRRDPWWNRRLAVDGYELVGPVPYWIVHEGPDGPDGMLAWRVTRDFELDGALGAIEVSDLVAANETAYRELWGYLAGIDVVDEITLPNRPLDEPIRWLLRDGRSLTLTGATDFAWLRLFDVPRALAARAYAVAGRLVLEVVDDSPGGYAAGRYALDVGEDGTATCAPTSERADLRIDQRVLAAAYLGGHRLRHHAIAGGVEEHTDGALHCADVLFAAALAPWCQTMF